ncbi:hypothetical protein ACS0TY_021765 [Phlomoides rotata]
MKHIDIVQDILKIHVSKNQDSRVWGHWVSGHLTSRMAYDLLRTTHPRVSWSSWILGPFIRPCRSTLIWLGINSPLLIGSPALAFMALRFIIFVSLMLKLLIISSRTDLSSDTFFIDTKCLFGKQLNYLWRHARNRLIFKEIRPTVHGCLAIVHAVIRESDTLIKGHMDGSVRELMVLGHLGLSGRPVHLNLS